MWHVARCCLAPHGRRREAPTSPNHPEKIQLRPPEAPNRTEKSSALVASLEVKPNISTRANTVVLDEEREKDFLTEPEMTRLLKGAGSNPHNLRDVAMLRMIYDHGLRLTEAISLRRSSIGLDAHRLHSSG
jgi:integrase